MSPAPPSRPLLLVADPHFGDEHPALPGALVALARQLRPAAVALAGDLTQRSTPAQWAATARFVAALRAVTRDPRTGASSAPGIVAVPGNHDLPWHRPWQRLSSPRRAWRAAVAPGDGDGFAAPPGAAPDDPGPADGFLCAGAFAIAAIDTTRAWRHRHGEITAGQVDRAALRLAAAPHGLVRAVLTHHPLLPAVPGDSVHVARGAAAALPRLAAAGAAVLLSGHVHRPAIVAWAGVPGGVAVGGGTATSRRTRHGTRNVAVELNVHGTGHERLLALRYWHAAPDSPFEPGAWCRIPIVAATAARTLTRRPALHPR